MIIDFQKMEEKRIPEFKGGNGDFIAKMSVDAQNKIICARLEPGSSIGYHRHDTGSEIIYILSGQADILYDDGKEIVEAGNCHYCPMGHSHSLRNLSDQELVFFAVVPEHMS